MRPIPDHVSSHERSAWSARSYEGSEHQAKADSSTQKLAALVEHGYSITWSARSSITG
jgi:hypothetical protein